MNQELDAIEAPEEPKHIKRKVKKKVVRSNHKHIYNYCLLNKIDDENYLIRATYCTICGKIGDRYIFETKQEEGTKWHISLTREELLEKYSAVKLFKVTNIFNKFVDVL